MAANLPRLAVLASDRTLPVIRGEVRVDGVDPDIRIARNPDEAVFGMLRGEFDVSEMSFAAFLRARADGNRFVALPAFLNRKFFQYYIFTTPQSGLRDLRDLRGRKVGCSMYWMTSSVWQRGLLRDQYGIHPSELEWYTTAPERMDSMAIPSDVRHIRLEGPGGVEELLLKGTIDCVLTARTAPIVLEQPDSFTRPFEDVDAVVRDYYRRTGIFGIAHVLVARDEVLRADANLAERLYQAFTEAKTRCQRFLANDANTSLPFMRSYLDDSRTVFGDDPWPYGLTRNRAAVETFLEYAHAQGLVSSPVTIEQIFAAELLDS